MSESGTSPDLVETSATYPSSNEYETLVGTMERPILNLTNQLKERVRGGEYSLLVGDDTSGRLPTLTLHKIINHISETSVGTNINLQFVQGGRNMETEAVRKRLAQINKQFHLQGDKKVLLITDYIRSGKTLKRYTDLLGSLGIKFDVATLDSEDPESVYRSNGDITQETILFSGNPHLGDEKHDRPPIFARASLTGLKRAYKPGIQVEVIKEPSMREDTLAARRDIEKLSNKIINQIL